MADQVLTPRGERSEYFGPTADSGDTLGASTDNLDSQMITERFTEAEINADPRLQTTTVYG